MWCYSVCVCEGAGGWIFTEHVSEQIRNERKSQFYQQGTWMCRLVIVTHTLVYVVNYTRLLHPVRGSKLEVSVCFYATSQFVHFTLLSGVDFLNAALVEINNVKCFGSYTHQGHHLTTPSQLSCHCSSLHVFKVLYCFNLKLMHILRHLYQCSSKMKY